MRPEWGILIVIAATSVSNPTWYLFQMPNGSMGDIRVGSEVSLASPLGGVIGQWQIVNTAAVPEPATVGLGTGLAMVGFAFARRRLKKA